MARVATYTRANLPVPQPRLVLSRQQQRLRDYISGQPEWKLTAEFSDHASAMDRKRPGFQELMRQAGVGAFDILLVASWDRLTRSTVEHMDLMQTFRKYDIEVWSPDRAGHASRDAEQVARTVTAYDSKVPL